MSVGTKHTFATSVFLKDKSKKLTFVSGGASLSWNDKSMSVSNIFDQQNNQKYSNDLMATIGKQKLSVKSIIKVVSDMEFEISNKIDLPESKPFTVAGQLNRNPRDFRLGAQIDDDFAIAFTSQYKPNTMIKVSGDVKVDHIRITADIETVKNYPQYSGKFDVKWDADKDSSKKIKVEGDLNVKSIKDINVKFVVENPMKNAEINYNHQIGETAQGHFDLSLAGKEQVNIEISHTGKSGMLSLKTPFKGYRMIT